jgi:Kelch motif
MLASGTHPFVIPLRWGPSRTLWMMPFLVGCLIGVLLTTIPVAASLPRRRQLQSVGQVTALRLILADTNQEVLNITNGTVIDAAQYLTLQFNIRAVTSGTVGSVRFGVDGNPRYRTDSSSPFSLCNATALDYDACPVLTVGPHTLTATPFAGTSATGVAGATVRVSFEIINSCRTPEVGIVSILEYSLRFSSVPPLISIRFVQFLDPTWTNFQPLYPLRVTEPMGLLVGDDIVLFGGFYNGVANVTNRTYARSVSKVNDVWRRMDDLPLPGGLTHAAQVAIGNKVYLCGGYSTYPGPHRTSCYVYDHAKAPGTKQWSNFSSLPIGSAGAGMIYDAARNALFYAGGRQSYNATDAGTLDVTNTWKYSFDRPGWVASTPIPYQANHQSAVTHTDAWGNQRHFFLGGQERLYECCRNRNATFEFRPATETWVRRADMPLARGHATASTRAIGCGLIMAGGSVDSLTGRDRNRTSIISYYDIPSDQWTLHMGNVPFAGATPIVVLPSNGYMHFVNHHPSSSRRRIAA